MDDFVGSMAIESWTLYAIGLVLIICRMQVKTPKYNTLSMAHEARLRSLDPHEVQGTGTGSEHG